MTSVIFAGPSVFGTPAAEFDGLMRLGPACRGDVAKAVCDGAAAIGLIDGLFGDRAAVWHTELLFALERGVTVFGAASMGALRAAECEPFGMIGIGGIYDDYHSGVRTGDADVAVLHAPAELDYAPLTVALVDAEAAIDELCAANSVAAAEAEALRAAARSLNFRDRTWSAMAPIAIADASRRADVLDLCLQPRVGRKRADAEALLNAIRATPSAIPVAGGRREATDHTLFLSALIRRQCGARADPS